jgi:hypothetical protein
VSALRSIGLWVAAAAMVATTGAAHMPDAEGVAHPVSASTIATTGTDKPQPTQPGGDVVATIPMASFGPADGAPQILVAGKTYPITVTVWIAATSGPAIVNVVASAGRLLGTTGVTVRAGVTRLHYWLVAGPGSTELSIAVNAHTRDGGIVTRSYNQQVR